jgi:hypothetical protein
MIDENQIKEIESEPHTLPLSQGNKWDEKTGRGAVASLPRGRRSHLVFAPPLPQGRKPEGRVRLKVVAMRDHQDKLKVDRNGDPLFRGTPAPVVHEDRWRQNPDGSFSRVKFSINWLLEEKEVGVQETRQPATKQEPGQKPPVNRVVWGTDLGTCKVQKIVTPTTVTFREVIVDMEKEFSSPGGIVPHLMRVSEVDGTPYVAAEWLAKAVAVITPQPQYLQVVYGSDLQFYLNIWTATPMDNQREQLAMYETWGNLPLWVQQHITTEYYPLCSCGRERWSTRQQHDGYQKCAICRTEESCSRCSKSEHLAGEIALTPKGMICKQCENRLPLEQLVEEHVSLSRRQEVVREAESLLGAKALEGEVGEMILEATLGHLTSKSELQDALRDRTGYAWYYWSEEGVYGSKFGPEALQLLSYYAQAKGDGLITFSAWLTGQYHKVNDCDRYNDFYWTTQVKGESLEPTFSGGALGQPLVVATKVLGRNADRTAALAGHQRLVEKLGMDALQVYEVWRVLCRSDQDYAEALQKIAAAEEAVRLKEESERRRADTEAQLPELLREHYRSCPICCEAIKWEEVRLEDSYEPNSIDGAYLCDCLNGSLDKAVAARLALQARWGEVQPDFGNRGRRQGTVLRRTKLGNDKFAAQAVVYHRHGRWNLVLLTYPEHFGELASWQTETV